MASLLLIFFLLLSFTLLTFTFFYCVWCTKKNSRHEKIFSSHHHRDDDLFRCQNYQHSRKEKGNVKRNKKFASMMMLTNFITTRRIFIYYLTHKKLKSGYVHKFINDWVIDFISHNFPHTKINIFSIIIH